MDASAYVQSRRAVGTLEVVGLVGLGWLILDVLIVVVLAYIRGRRSRISL